MGNCASGCTGPPAGKTPYGSDAPKQFGVKLESENKVKKNNHVFFMVNSTAGGKVAANLLKLGLERFDTSFEHELSAEVWFYDLIDPESRKNGFAFLRMKHMDPKCEVRVVACGGDGTVKWVISELEIVDCRDVPIGVIPFGTGNDMARCLGWGGYPPNPLIGKNLSAIRKRVKLVLESKIQPLDVWKVVIKLKEGNDSKFVEVKKGKETLNTGATSEGVMVQSMINYTSIGADAKIIFKFEQNRQNTQVGNKMMYAALGGGQTFVPPPQIKKFIQSLYTVDNETSDKGKNEGEIKLSKKLEPNMGARALVFSNIPSYGGGQDIWKVLNKKKQKGLRAQQFGDGLLESMTLASARDIGLMVATGGLSREISGIKRVAQEAAYRVTFVTDNKVYIQVDGEGIKVVNGDSVTITKYYQVNMLLNQRDLPGNVNGVEIPTIANENEDSTKTNDMETPASENLEITVEEQRKTIEKLKKRIEELENTVIQSDESKMASKMSDSEKKEELEQLEKDVEVTLKEEEDEEIKQT